MRKIVVFALGIFYGGTLGVAWGEPCWFGPPQAERESLSQLRTLVATRLLLAHEVALAKWNRGGAIEDRARERRVLDEVARAARQRGLSEADAVRFFELQVEASKRWQRQEFRLWRLRDPDLETPDLARDVRPLLDGLTGPLLEALAGALREAPGARVWAVVEEALSDAP